MLARFDSALADARRSLASGNLADAARAMETARTIDPTSPSLVELGANLASAARDRDASARQSSSRLPPASSSLPPPPGATAKPAAPAVAAPPPPPPVAPVPVPEALPPAVTRPTEPPPRVEPPPVPAKEPVAPPPPVERVGPPPPPAPDTEESAIRQLIVTYGRAIEGKDLALFRSIKPNLNAQEERRLQEGFRAVSSQRVSLSIVSIDRKDNSATAVVRRRDDIEAGGRKQTTDTRQVLTLARTPGGWVIVEIR